MRLSYTAIGYGLNPDITLDTSWKSNLKESTIQRFAFYVKNNDTCQTLVGQMKANPSVMAQNLKLDIHLTAEKRATRTITIKGSSFAKSRMFASLKNMLPDSGTRYMQSRDANKLMNEVVSNIVVEEVVSGSYVAQDDQLVVKDLLSKQLNLPTVQSQHLAKHE